MEVNEIQIPVPWGFVAAKVWGDKSNPVVLSLHGWADNASTFDMLIPYLPKCYYYVCIDLPGQGRSPPVTTSLILTDLDYIIVLKLVYNYLKCDKIIFMAHSLGGFLAATFTQLYPKCVSKLITLDVMYFYPRPFFSQFDRLKIFLNTRIKFIPKESSEIRAYTKEEILKKLMNGRLTPLSRKAAEILMERSIEPVANGKYKITIAQNVKHMVLTTLPIEGYVAYAEKYPIKCPHLIILSSSTSFVRAAYRKLENVFKKNPDYELHVVEGTHEFHIENPEMVAPVINQFLRKHKNKL